MSFRLRVLASGSSGNASLVEAGATRILLDAGLGATELAERLESAKVDPASLAAIVLSHEHADHARGAAAFSRKWGVRLCGSRGTYGALGLAETRIAGFDLIQPDATLWLGTLGVRGVAVPHDALAPLAFVLSWEGRSLGHATDLGHVPRVLTSRFRECDAILVESNYDERLLLEGTYPWSVKERILSSRGHLSNADVAGYLDRDLGEACRDIVLAHLSRSNNRPDLVRESATVALRRRGRTEVRVHVSEPDGTDWIEIGGALETRREWRQLRLW